MTQCCNAPEVRALPPRGETRCSGCGHRQPTEFGGVVFPPVESRRLPFWTWPGELLGRYLATTALRRAWI